MNNHFYKILKNSFYTLLLSAAACQLIQAASLNNGNNDDNNLAISKLDINDIANCQLPAMDVIPMENGDVISLMQSPEITLNNQKELQIANQQMNKALNTTIDDFQINIDKKTEWSNAILDQKIGGMLDTSKQIKSQVNKFVDSAKTLQESLQSIALGVNTEVQLMNNQTKAYLQLSDAFRKENEATFQSGMNKVKQVVAVGINSMQEIHKTQLKIRQENIEQKMQELNAIQTALDDQNAAAIERDLAKNKAEIAMKNENAKANMKIKEDNLTFNIKKTQEEIKLKNQQAKAEDEINRQKLATKYLEQQNALKIKKENAAIAHQSAMNKIKEENTKFRFAGRRVFGLPKGASYMSSTTWSQWYAAVRGGNLSEMQRLYTTYNVNLERPDYSDSHGITALGWAVYCNQFTAAELLLAMGANVNTRASKTQYTPLYYAAVCNKHYSFIPLLMAYGASYHMTVGSSTIYAQADSTARNHMARPLSYYATYPLYY